MTYNELKEKVLVGNHQCFNEVVGTITLLELDSLIKEGWGSPYGNLNDVKNCTSKINNVLALTEKKGTAEQLSAIYYRIFFLVDSSLIALDYRTAYILPIIENGYAHFKEQEEIEGIALLGTYLVDAIMYQWKDTDSAVKILTESLSAAKNLEDNKGELYTSIIFQSKIFYSNYTELFGDKLDIFIDEFYKTELTVFINDYWIEQLQTCCKILYNQFKSVDVDRADYYIKRLRYFQK